ncbi:hypothetical protein K449DRAFT_456028 [Hypoxylon sp. EC38]|nr:hypothetical protein K449DRAFT_456028 [Hypoxylon sp. EC38]
MTIKQISDPIHTENTSSEMPSDPSLDENERLRETRFVLPNRREKYGKPFGASAHLTPETRMKSTYYLELPTFRFPGCLERPQKPLSTTESPDETNKASKANESQGEGEECDNQTQSSKQKLLGSVKKKLDFLWDGMWWIRIAVIALISLIPIDTFILFTIVFILRKADELWNIGFMT